MVTYPYTQKHLKMLNEIAKYPGDDFRWARAIWRYATGLDIAAPRVSRYALTVQDAEKIERVVLEGLDKYDPKQISIARTPRSI